MQTVCHVRFVENALEKYSLKYGPTVGVDMIAQVDRDTGMHVCLQDRKGSAYPVVVP